MESENKAQDEIKKVEQQIQDTIKKSAESDFEIEVTDEKTQEQETKPKAEQPEKKESEEEYSAKVQKRINKLISQRRDAEQETEKLQQQYNQLQTRLERLEKGSQTRVENEFNKRYAETKQALAKAVEEGDTQAQVDFSEQLADMRATMRVNEMQRRQQKIQAQNSPTVGHAEAASVPPPQKAMDWWQKNRWFNAQGFEKETAAARAIDVQLDVEGYDKNSEEYYDNLNSRLRKLFPELILPNKAPERTKNRSPVAPTASTSSTSAYNGNRVRLTTDQLRMARELGITDEKSLKKYESEIRNQQNNGRK